MSPVCLLTWNSAVRSPPLSIPFSQLHKHRSLLLPHAPQPLSTLGVAHLHMSPKLELKRVPQSWWEQGNSLFSRASVHEVPGRRKPSLLTLHHMFFSVDGEPLARQEQLSFLGSFCPKALHSSLGYLSSLPSLYFPHAHPCLACLQFSSH